MNHNTSQDETGLRHRPDQWIESPRPRDLIIVTATNAIHADEEAL